jgi:hypothetical protein
MLMSGAAAPARVVIHLQPISNHQPGVITLRGNKLGVLAMPWCAILLQQCQKTGSKLKHCRTLLAICGLHTVVGDANSALTGGNANQARTGGNQY